MHLRELGLFEIRDDPDIFLRNDRHQRLARLNDLAGLHGLLAHDAGDRRFDGGVFQIQARLIQRRLRQLNAGFGRLACARVMMICWGAVLAP